MRLSKLTIAGFRCFGPDGATIDVDDLTAYVGANGTGKSAALMALVRMFGTTNAQRTLTREDFHVLADDGDAAAQRGLRIEAQFELPELEDDEDAAGSAAVPECLKHIIVSDSGPTPICRIRLDGTWSPGRFAEGEVEQKLWWVNSDLADAPTDKVFPLSAVERRLIQAFYVPATRDAVRELRTVSGTILMRVLNRIRWSDDLKGTIAELDQELIEAVRSEAGLADLEAMLRLHWANLFGASAAPAFAFADADLAGILRRLDAQITGSEGSRPLGLLSEGERSLLYFALVESALTFEAKLAKDPSAYDGTQPILTLILVEEPENHLAPQYLGRVLKALRGLVDSGGVQALVTSHSASIMRRVEPTEVRHFRAEANGARRITKLSLPSDDEEAFKYVREAVKAYPELYFSAVVVLGEGASEEVVIPRVARALDLDIDPRFVAVVPLGGRHVRHFWRLLHDIGTPYVTLVDLDNERRGGGWERVHDLMRELLDLGVDRDAVLDDLSTQEYDALPTWGPDPITDEALASWIAHLEEEFDVFLSAPLDLDFSMLRAFPKAYKALAPKGGGPRFPKPNADQKPFITRVTRSTLGAEGGDGATYTKAERELFPWYAYLFTAGSKPANHALALSKRSDATLAKRAPDVLRRLVERVKQLAPK